MASDGVLLTLPNAVGSGGFAKFKSHKVLPHRRSSAENKIRSEDANHILHGMDEESTPPPSLQQSAMLSSNATSAANLTDLPPTPPSTNPQELAPAAEIEHARERGQDIPSLTVQRASISTPLNNRSPPTPDPSPPRPKGALSSPLPHPNIRYPSSRAESFTTAREEQWSSTSEASHSQVSLARASSRGDLDSKYVSPKAGLGLDFLRPEAIETPATSGGKEDESADTTPGADNKDHRLSPMGTIPDREWNTELMRNVTVRRKNSRPSTPPQQTGELSSRSLPSSPSAKRDFSMHKRMFREKERSRVASAGNDSVGAGSSWPEEVSSALNRHISESDSKRNSTASSVSTVVEAMVVVTPPKKRQGLRHAGKNLALRGPAGSPPSPTIERPHRSASLQSDSAVSHRLMHKKSPIPDRRQRHSISSETALEAARPDNLEVSQDSSTVQKPVRREHATFGSSTPTEPQVKQRSVSSPIQNLYPSPAVARGKTKGYFDVPKSSHSNESASSPMVQYISPYANPSPVPARERYRVVSAPISTSAVLGEITARNSVTPSIGSDYSRRRRPTSSSSRLRDVTSAEHATVILHHLDVDSDEGSEAEHDSGHGSSAGNDATNSRKALSSFLDSPAPSERRSPVPRTGTSFLRSPAPSEGRSPDNSKDTGVFGISPETLTIRSRPSLAATEDIPRPSIDDTGFHRMSLTSTLRTDEYALARNQHMLHTPFSQFSSTPDALEVSEATAVSIYPHNNNSLLVVQQVARSNTTSRRETATEDVQADAIPSVRPQLNIEPSTPPQPPAVAAFADSPLTNPRTAPTPPAFKIIPPTPMDELERELVGPVVLATESRPPVRRISLKERARRYSDNLIAPILARAPSKARRATSNPPIHRIPSVTEENGNLHPFWRPRGFWDGFSDSSSDSDYWDSDEDDEALPPSRPQTQPTSRLPLGRRLTNGFKGSGGFLIGNSLGVSRHGSNNRRHHVSLPAHFPRGTQGQAKRASYSPLNSTRIFNAFSPRDRATVQMRSTHPALNPLGRIEKKIVGLYSQQNSSFSSRRTGGRRSVKGRESGMAGVSQWGKVHRIPGLGMNVQYVGIRGVADRVREKRAERRREVLRKSIGARVVVGDGRPE